MKILFIGKPGAGKGTITQNLMKEDSNFLQLSTGNLYVKKLSVAHL